MRTISPLDIKGYLADRFKNSSVYDADEVAEALEELAHSLNDNSNVESRVLWTSLGYNAEVTHSGKRWVLRAFPGGFSAKCETGAFHMDEAKSLQEAMAKAEGFVLGDEEQLTKPSIIGEAQH